MKNNKNNPQAILYLPATNKRFFSKALESDSDLIILDLEASVDQEMKEVARNNIREIFEEKYYEKNVGIRINPLNTIEGIKDIRFLLDLNLPIYCIVLTLVKNYYEIKIIKEILNESNYKNINFFVTIETNEALENLDLISNYSNGLILGSADLAAILGVQISWDNMLYARQKMVYHGSTHSILVYDTACFDIWNTSLLEFECEKCKELGFHGKVAIHPSQINTIKEGFSGSKEEIKLAKEILSKKDDKDTIKIINGKMVGPPFIKWAEKILNK